QNWTITKYEIGTAEHCCQVEHGAGCTPSLRSCEKVKNPPLPDPLLPPREEKEKTREKFFTLGGFTAGLMQWADPVDPASPANFQGLKQPIVAIRRFESRSDIFPRAKLCLQRYDTDPQRESTFACRGWVETTRQREHQS